MLHRLRTVTNGLHTLASFGVVSFLAIWLSSCLWFLLFARPVNGQGTIAKRSLQAQIASITDIAASVKSTLSTSSATPPCPPAWGIVTSPNPSASTNHLLGVDAASPNDIWAVGQYNAGGGQYRALTLHWDGNSWTHYAPSPSEGADALYAVEIISSNDVWAVGKIGTPNGQLPLTQHWDGVQWSVVPCPSPRPVENNLHGISVVSSNDIWAVGFWVDNVGGLGYSRTLVEHWNGTQWSVVPSPNASGDDNSLEDVSAVSSNDVWAVGYALGPGALIEHWNGVQWSVISNPNPPGAQVSNLYGVSATSSNDVWAVGRWGDTYDRTLIKHWNGVQWSVVPSPDVGVGGTNWLFGVSASSTDNVWAVGYYCCVPGGAITLTEHWDGVQWSLVPSPNPTAANNYFRGVAAISSDDVWAVGYAGGGVWRTTIEHYSVTDACLTPSPTPTSTITRTNTRTPTRTRTPTNTSSPTNTLTSTPTSTATFPASETSTSTPTNTEIPASTDTPTRTPTFESTLIGHVIWEGRPSQPHTLQQLPITLTLKLGTLEANYPEQLTDPYGYFTLTLEGLPTGTYTWRANDATSEQHPPNYLAKLGNFELTGEPTTYLDIGLLRAGDANNDNVVSTTDFTILKNTFGKGQGDPGYDNRADFNGSTSVNTQDFNLLKGNFGQGGAPPIGPEVR